jgi:ABC-type sugar transport system substrate-binding protein
MLRRAISWVAALSCVATVTSALPSAAGAQTKFGSLSGKKVLFIPYWLDDYGTAMSSWVTRDFKKAGATVVTENPNGVTSAQLTTLETAISSHAYAGIIWQPVDVDSALVTIRQVEAAKIPQVILGANVPQSTVHFSEAPVGYATEYKAAGRMAALYIKAHPDLGPPRIAYQDISPETTDTHNQFASLVAGVRSVTPSAKVVYDQGATTQARADSEMSDFIERHVAFNIFGGSGTALSMGGVTAIDAAGLGGAKPGSRGATNKMPEHVYMATSEGAPSELQLLWSPKSSLMAAPTLSPESNAAVVVKLLENQLTGKTAYNQKVVVPMQYSTITSNCQTQHKVMIEAYAGVKGFTVPKCP